MKLRLYLAGNNSDNVDPTFKNREEALLKLCKDIDQPFNRLCSFYYEKILDTVLTLQDKENVDDK